LFGSAKGPREDKDGIRNHWVGSDLIHPSLCCELAATFGAFEPVFCPVVLNGRQQVIAWWESNPNLIHPFLRREFSVTLGTPYPAMDRVVVLNRRLSVPKQETTKKDEPDPSRFP